MIDKNSRRVRRNYMRTVYAFQKKKKNQTKL